MKSCSPSSRPPRPACARRRRRAPAAAPREARRELEACEQNGCDADVSFIEGELRRAQQLGEESRKQLGRALADVGGSAPRWFAFELTEAQAQEATERAKDERAYQRLVEGEQGWLAGWQLAEASRRRDDTRSCASRSRLT